MAWWAGLAWAGHAEQGQAGLGGEAPVPVAPSSAAVLGPGGGGGGANLPVVSTGPRARVRGLCEFARGAGLRQALEGVWTSKLPPPALLHRPCGYSAHGGGYGYRYGLLVFSLQSALCCAAMQFLMSPCGIFLIFRR